MFLPSRSIAPPFPIQEYADPDQQALFEAQTRYAPEPDVSTCRSSACAC